MNFRNLVLLCFGAGLVLSWPAIAGAPPADLPGLSAASGASVIEVATSKPEVVKKKKKLPANARKGKGKTPPLTAEELAAKKKADEKAKKEAAAKAKAAEKAKLAAQAKAEREKRLAAEKIEREKQAAAAKVARDKELAAAKLERDKKLAAKAKVDEERRIARIKAEEERRIAKAKAEEERKVVAEQRRIAKAKAEEERRIAKAKAEEEYRLAKAKAAEEHRLAAEAKARAAEELRLAKLRAEEERRLAIAAAAEAARQAELARLASTEIAQTGNNGELRSETPEVANQQVGLFGGLFGGPVKKQAAMLPETRALDAVLELKDADKKFQVASEFEPQAVAFGGFPRGTIVIDTSSRFLYLVESSSRARRYAIAVGREGLEFKGTGKIGDKQEWPRWIPTIEMQQREPEKYGQYKDGMPGGPENPLGARAMYVYQGGKDTHIRIHGTNQPQTIGTNSSNGCFRMINEHVMDLYRRVKVGAEVVVM